MGRIGPPKKDYIGGHGLCLTSATRQPREKDTFAHTNHQNHFPMLGVLVAFSGPPQLASLESKL